MICLSHNSGSARVIKTSVNVVCCRFYNGLCSGLCVCWNVGLRSKAMKSSCKISGLKPTEHLQPVWDKQVQSMAAPPLNCYLFMLYLYQNVPLRHSIFCRPVLVLQDPKDLLLKVQTADSTANLQRSSGAHTSLVKIVLGSGLAHTRALLLKYLLIHDCTNIQFNI